MSGRAGALAEHLDRCDGRVVGRGLQGRFERPTGHGDVVDAEHGGGVHPAGGREDVEVGPHGLAFDVDVEESPAAALLAAARSAKCSRRSTLVAALVGSVVAQDPWPASRCRCCRGTCAYSGSSVVPAIASVRGALDRRGGRGEPAGVRQSRPGWPRRCRCRRAATSSRYSASRAAGGATRRFRSRSRRSRSSPTNCCPPLWETRIPAYERASNSLPAKVAGAVNVVGSSDPGAAVDAVGRRTVRGGRVSDQRQVDAGDAAGDGIAPAVPIVVARSAISARTRCRASGGAHGLLDQRDLDVVVLVGAELDALPARSRRLAASSRPAIRPATLNGSPVPSKGS